MLQKTRRANLKTRKKVFNDFVVKDLGLADFGRKEIELAELVQKVVFTETVPYFRKCHKKTTDFEGEEGGRRGCNCLFCGHQSPSKTKKSR